MREGCSFLMYRNIESYSCNLRKVKIKMKSRPCPFSWKHGRVMRLLTNHTNLFFARINFNLLKEPRPKAWFKFQPFTLTYIFGPVWHGSFFSSSWGRCVWQCLAGQLPALTCSVLMLPCTCRWMKRNQPGSVLCVTRRLPMKVLL